MLVQPATVDRWCREGVRRWWRRHARRAGRPRIDSSCRDLIQRMAADNCLWGAPRIHGELLKLGITVSERTVSRYLRGRPPKRSQTWRTFLANHLGDPTLISPVKFADARGDDIVVDASDRLFRSSQLPINASRVSAHCAFNCGPPRASPARSPSGPCWRTQKCGPGPAAASMVATATASVHAFHPCARAAPLRPTAPRGYSRARVHHRQF